jgi:hypothetical protein
VRYDDSVTHAARALLLLLLVTPALRAYQATLDLHTIDDAIAIGESRIESVRLRFHEPYRVNVQQPPVDYVDVVTPFRRVVLAAEGRRQAGDRRFGQRDALAAIGDRAETLELFVELTFHPQNTFIGVPPYEVHVTREGTTRDIPPRAVDRVPRYGARVDGFPLPYPFPTVPAPRAGSQPLLGGTLVVAFDPPALDPTGRYDVVVGENGKAVARLTINLATLR